MPRRETVEAFIALVEAGKFDIAMERFYADDASMQENQDPPRKGLAALVEGEHRTMARSRNINAQCVRPVLIEGDTVVIRWHFDFEMMDGRRSCWRRSRTNSGAKKKCSKRNSSTIPSRWVDDAAEHASSQASRTDYNCTMNVQRFDPTHVFSREEMATLRERSDVTGMLCVIHAWVVIGAAMALYAICPNPLTFVLAVVIIGSRQLGLAILMHDAAHGVLMKTRWLNEWVGQWLCAYPVLGEMIGYRHYHLVHHRRTQQPDDPDLGLSAKFPITKESFRRKMIRDLTGQTGFKQRKAQFIRALGEPGQPFVERAKTFWQRVGPQYTAQLILLALMTAFGKPHYFLMFWVLPNITWHMAITRIRNIAEHAVVPDDNDVFRNARTTYASWWVRALVAPYWVNYHVDHHLLYYVSCYNLPKLHALLLAKGFRDKMEIQPDYLTLLRLATSKPSQVVAQPA